MTDNDIIKAFEICYTGGEEDCFNCPFCDEDGECMDKGDSELLEEVGYLLNRQMAEIERKTKHIAEIIDEYARFKEAAKRQEQARVRNIEQVADEEIKSLKAEIERFEKETEQTIHSIREMAFDSIKVAKSEAYKEFAERLKQVGTKVEGRKGFEGVYVMVNNLQIDNLLEKLQNGVKE